MKGFRSFSRRTRASAPLRARQGGTILIIALIVLVAMTLAGIATMRSVDTATITAGNIGLRQASVNAADQGIQAGVNWLTANLGATLINDSHQPGTASKGYFSSVPVSEPNWYDSLNWSEAGQLNNGNPDAGGNVVFFLIHRLCAVPDCDTNATCGSNPPNTCASTLSTAVLTGQGSDQTRPTDSHTSAPAIHYRVTAKAVGPRNSISIVQSMVRAFN
jgi:type IV pilus assembly protein PilX